MTYEEREKQLKRRCNKIDITDLLELNNIYSSGSVHNGNNRPCDSFTAFMGWIRNYQDKEE